MNPPSRRSFFSGQLVHVPGSPRGEYGVYLEPPPYSAVGTPFLLHYHRKPAPHPSQGWCIRALASPEDLVPLKPWGPCRIQAEVEREVFYVWRVPAHLGVSALEIGWVPDRQKPHHGGWACGVHQPGLCRGCGTIRAWSLVPWLVPGPWLL